MQRWRHHLAVTLALGALVLPAACSDTVTVSPEANGSGHMVVRLTDAPFLTDSLKRVDIFVVRVEARATSADSAAADDDLDDGSSSGWRVLASPNASYDLLSLQNGVTTTLGEGAVPAGTYNGFRLIIDPSRSSVTLKGGQVLTGGSKPGVTFPSASRSGIKVILSHPVTIDSGETTTLLVDFDVNSSFVMRGNSIDKNGLLFKPVIRATVTDLATTNATIRLTNATATPITLLQAGSVLTGGSDIAFGASSACSSVNAGIPALSVIAAGSTTPLGGFAPVLHVGNTYTLVAWPGANGGVQFTTLENTFVPATGQSGLRVFNATADATGYDAYVTAAGAPLATATVANTLAGVASSFVGVPAGSSQLRVTAAGGTTVLVDLGAQTLAAGQSATLVIAPPAAGTTTPRAFLVGGC